MTTRISLAWARLAISPVGPALTTVSNRAEAAAETAISHAMAMMKRKARLIMLTFSRQASRSAARYRRAEYIASKAPLRSPETRTSGAEDACASRPESLKYVKSPPGVPGPAARVSASCVGLLRGASRRNISPPALAVGACLRLNRVLPTFNHRSIASRGHPAPAALRFRRNHSPACALRQAQGVVSQSNHGAAIRGDTGRPPSTRTQSRSARRRPRAPRSPRSGSPRLTDCGTATSRVPSRARRGRRRRPAAARGTRCPSRPRHLERDPVAGAPER